MKSTQGFEPGHLKELVYLISIVLYLSIVVYCILHLQYKQTQTKIHSVLALFLTCQDIGQQMCSSFEDSEVSTSTIHLGHAVVLVVLREQRTRPTAES